MTKKEIIKVFEERKVRTVWDDKEEKWYCKSAISSEKASDYLLPHEEGGKD